MANEPITREEILLNAVATGEATNLEPITREEMFLAKLGGADVNTPMPITRKEQFLQKAIESGGSGGGGIASVSEKDINFYDYDGALLHSYTVAEAQALTDLPELPSRPGLICQGWNWSLENIKAHNRAMNVGATYITDDGTTRIYITLHEGRTSPMLGVCPNGTVTVDWGDGTEPDVLTGTSTSTVKRTPNHEYKAPGDYVIRLTVDGEMGFGGNSSVYSYLLSHTSSGSDVNRVYFGAIEKIEIGNGVTRLSTYSFGLCRNIKTISIPNSVIYIGENSIYSMDKLIALVIPDGVKTLSRTILSCNNLRIVSIPNSVTTVKNILSSCPQLDDVVFPNGVTNFDSMFGNCYAMRHINIHHGVESIVSCFSGSYSVSSVFVPSSVTTLGSSAFNCMGIRYYDFTEHTVIPTVTASNAFNGIPADCEIRVPAALYDEWIAATNWSNYASYIKAV